MTKLTLEQWDALMRLVDAKINDALAYADPDNDRIDGGGQEFFAGIEAKELIVENQAERIIREHREGTKSAFIDTDGDDPSFGDETQ